MKYTAILVMMLIAWAYSDVPAQYKVKSGKELIRLLEGDEPGTYLVMFFDHNADKGRVTQFRNKVKQQIGYIGSGGSTGTTGKKIA